VCDQEFKLNLDRYKYPNRYDLSDGMTHREQGVVYLKQLEERLSKTDNLIGANWTWVDAAIAPFVRQFARTDRTWFNAQAWPALKQWLEKFEQSPEFETVMHKYKVWHQDAKPVAFPATVSTN
jgi:glutathione S-transferase